MENFNDLNRRKTIEKQSTPEERRKRTDAMIKQASLEMLQRDLMAAENNKDEEWIEYTKERIKQLNEEVD